MFESLFRRNAVADPHHPPQRGQPVLGLEFRGKGGTERDQRGVGLSTHTGEQDIEAELDGKTRVQRGEASVEQGANMRFVL